MVGERRSQNFSIDKASQGHPSDINPTRGLLLIYSQPAGLTLVNFEARDFSRCAKNAQKE